MRQYKGIFFDLGYTLVRTDRELSMQKRMMQLQIDCSLLELEHAYHATDKYYMQHQPGLLALDSRRFFPNYIRRVADYLGLQLADKELDHLARVDDGRGVWSLIPGVQDGLKTLRDSGLHVGLISNWDESARPLLQRLKLEDLFESIIISSEIGMQKPNPDIFLTALKHAGITAESALYVGDNYYDDVVGARKAGLDAVLINRFGKLGIEDIQDCQIYESVTQVIDSVLSHAAQPAHGRATP
ncbi:HAD family hydrolase [Alicyclobacillus sp. SO9]|uniref:HAD family hydrolase n=1 Tax=Alicyclobacillus sp. SO9 TaxID=2665646 RepID=UPI0018E85DC0|nr:HAD-IA family hydrolase [Alicyclobacillus sp. SO9]QQE78197.1 HAD-IA family hydrolase [Alicyclobacillus sp. SO9]